MKKQFTNRMRLVLGALSLFVIAFVAIGVLSIETLDGSNLLTTGLAVLATAPIAWIKNNAFVELTGEEFKALTDEEKMLYHKAVTDHRKSKELELAEKITKLSVDAESNKTELAELKAELSGINAADFKDTLKAVQAISTELAKQKDAGVISNNTYQSKVKKAWDDNFKSVDKAHTDRGVHSFAVSKATQTYGDITSGSDF